MKVATFNGVKVYNLSSGKTMPQWLSDNQRRKLLKDDEYRRRLELIQDFEMTVASQNITMTNDGEHIIVTGTYPPVVRCYTVSDLALKFQRGLTCEVVAMQTLSDDFGKLVFLQSDRTLNFHAPYGAHYSLRVPKFGRDLAYNFDSCDLNVASCGEEVYRLNLETGQFKEPLLLGFAGCNKLHINPAHKLLGCGGQGATCEFWDTRSTKKAASRIVVDPLSSVEVTALKFDSDGLTLAVGTSHGNTLIYDIRSRVPMFTKEHQYGLPVIDVTFHNPSRHIISTDKKVVKIWERDVPSVGRTLTNIETPADINAVHVVADKRGQSGMIFLAGEQSRVMTYFVPQLGPAPRWCSFLEGLTEELEETAGQSVYEDYKFLTKTEVDELGASALIGTPILKGYMHGFFIEMKLYNRLRAVSKPFEYEEYRLKRIRDRIEEKRQSRIVPQKRLPKINKELAEKLMKTGAPTGADDDEADINFGIDERFAALFKREEFQQDATSEEFKLKNPSKGNNYKGRSSGYDSEDDLDNREVSGDDDRMFTVVDNNQGLDDDDNYSSDGREEDDYEYGYGHDEEDDLDDHIRSAYRSSNSSTGASSGKRKRRSDGIDDDEGNIRRASRRMSDRMRDKVSDKAAAPKSKSVGIDRKATGPRMFELSDGVSSRKALFGNREGGAWGSEDSGTGERGLPLSERVRLNADNGGDGRQEGLAPGSNINGRGDARRSATGRRDSEVKIIRSATDGLVRELSYMPSTATVTKGRGGSSVGFKKADREAAAFFDQSSRGDKAGAVHSGGAKPNANKKKGRGGRF